MNINHIMTLMSPNLAKPWPGISLFNDSIQFVTLDIDRYVWFSLIVVRNGPLAIIVWIISFIIFTIAYLNYLGWKFLLSDQAYLLSTEMENIISVKEKNIHFEFLVHYHFERILKCDNTSFGICHIYQIFQKWEILNYRC